MLASLPAPSLFPETQHAFNSILLFKPNWALVQATIYLAYYFMLFPTAAVRDADRLYILNRANIYLS